MSSDSKSVPSLSYYAIIPHSNHQTVFVYENSDGWTLPHITTDDWTKLTVNALSAHIRDLADLEATALRRVLIHRNGDDLLRSFLLMENHRPEMVPMSGRWIGRDEINKLTDLLQQQAVQRWFDEPSEEPPLRTPWAKPGWFARTREWVEEMVQKAGFRLTGPLHIQRSWSLTCMLVQPTDQGNLYIKATNAMFGPEAELTSLLGEWFPQYVPEVVAYDASEHLYIMREFVAEPLHEIKEPATWETIAATHARIQRFSLEHIDQLLALGCWDRRPLALISYVDDLVCDPEPLHIGQPNGLTEAEFAQYQAAGPRLKALCEEVDALNVPYTLTHGDFHAGNIGIRENGPIFFDWSDASIAHPFMDLYSTTEQYDEQGLDIRDRVRQAYLKEWADIIPAESLEPAFDLAIRLSILNQAISYRYIYHHIEPFLREEIDGACVPLAKQIIQRFGD